MIIEGEAVLEDIVFGASQLLPQATAKYAAKISGKKISDSDLKATVAKKKGKTWAEWTRQEGAILAGLGEKDELSPVGIAREYVELLESTTAQEIREGAEYESTMVILKWIVDKLELPPLTAVEDKILSET
jgi:hypothetical protein